MQVSINKWQDTNRHPQNTMRSPYSQKKMDLPHENGTAKFHHASALAAAEYANLPQR